MTIIDGDSGGTEIDFQFFGHPRAKYGIGLLFNRVPPRDRELICAGFMVDVTTTTTYPWKCLPTPETWRDDARIWDGIANLDASFAVYTVMRAEQGITFEPVANETLEIWKGNRRRGL